MYSKVMVPVDLVHSDKLVKALATVADLCKQYQIPACYVGVTATTPGPLAHNPAEFAEKLREFAQLQAAEYGIEATSVAYTSDDPRADLDHTLMQAISETGADLVVMASHIPGIPDYLFHSNASHLAVHAKVSVLIVR